MDAWDWHYSVPFTNSYGTGAGSLALAQLESETLANGTVLSHLLHSEVDLLTHEIDSVELCTFPSANLGQGRFTASLSQAGAPFMLYSPPPWVSQLDDPLLIGDVDVASARLSPFIVNLFGSDVLDLCGRVDLSTLVSFGDAAHVFGYSDVEHRMMDLTWSLNETAWEMTCSETGTARQPLVCPRGSEFQGRGDFIVIQEGAVQGSVPNVIIHSRSELGQWTQRQLMWEEQEEEDDARSPISAEILSLSDDAVALLWFEVQLGPELYQFTLVEARQSDFWTMRKQLEFNVTTSAYYAIEGILTTVPTLIRDGGVDAGQSDVVRRAVMLPEILADSIGNSSIQIDDLEDSDTVLFSWLEDLASGNVLIALNNSGSGGDLYPSVSSDGTVFEPWVRSTETWLVFSNSDGVFMLHPPAVTTPSDTGSSSDEDFIPSLAILSLVLLAGCTSWRRKRRST